MNSDLYEAIRSQLDTVMDPELGAPLGTLGMIGDLTFSDGQVRVEVLLTTAACPRRRPIAAAVTDAVRLVPAVTDVDVAFSVMSAEQKSETMRAARTYAQTHSPTTSIPVTTPVVAFASGKGGVGKSSVTANVAMILAERGYRVGVLDGDVWGFSLPRLLGIDEPIAARAGKMQPSCRSVGAGDVRLLSMGLLSDESTALLWRGQVIQRAVGQFIEDADWGNVDYLLIDTPPGTGDVAMALARLLPQTGYVVVTTPALAAQRVAIRAADFARRSNLRVLGVIENMSPFACSCGVVHAVFGSGGGESLSAELGVPLLGGIALHETIRQGGDDGVPGSTTDARVRADYDVIVDRLINDVAPPRGNTDCTASILAAMERAVDQSS